MSYSVDANVLLYAAQEAADVHEEAVKFLESCEERDEPLCLSWSVINAFLRLSTDGRAFARPLSPAQAREWIDELINLPQTKLISEEPGFWKLYAEVSKPLNPRGAGVTDVHLAAVLKQHDVRTLYSRDAGFRRFDFFRTVNPFAPAKKAR